MVFLEYTFMSFYIDRIVSEIFIYVVLKGYTEKIIDY